MRIYKLDQSPYYRVDGLSASANMGDNKENSPVSKAKPAKKGEPEKKLSQADGDSSIVIYA